MRTVKVQYTLKPECVADNERLVQAVFEQLAREQPAGLRYQSFKLDDGVSFMHVASMQDGLDGNPLTRLQAFRDFTAGIKDRCAVQPVTAEIGPVGAFWGF